MKSEKGLTLVEVMVALVVFLFVFLALMQTALLSIEANMNAVLREEGVRLAEERMNDARSRSFNSTIDTLTAPSTSGGAKDALPLTSAACPSATFRTAFPNGVAYPRNVRNITGFPFCTNRTVTYTPGAAYATVTVAVGWQWKNIDYRTTITTIIKKVAL